jgi:transcriptional antiterminator RfaH
MVLAGKAARYAPGVRDFVKFGPRVAQVSEEVIEALVERCPGGIAAVAMRPYRPGETIAIKEGPFAGLEAMFEREMADSERVAVLIEILGRQTRLVLASEMVGRA